MGTVCEQVGTRAGYAWENKWWEAAFDRTAQAIKVRRCAAMPLWQGRA